MGSLYRITLYLIYIFIAFSAPALMAVFPRSGAYLPNKKVISVAEGRFATPQQVIGEGANSYDPNILASLPDRLATIGADYADGTNVVVARFSSPEAAVRGVEIITDMLPHVSLTSSGWWTELSTGGGRHAIIVRAEDILVVVVGDGNELARKRLAAVPALMPNPNPEIMTVITEQYFGWLFGGLLGYSFVQLWIMFRMGSWAATKMPTARQADPVKAAGLHDCFMQLNDPLLPFDVTAGADDEIIVSWKTSGKWREKMSASGAKELSRVRLRLDTSRHLVRGQYQKSKISWKAGLPTVKDPTVLELQWKKEIKIPLFQIKIGASAVWKDGHLQVGDSYHSRFQSDEIYDTVTAIVTSSGWTYRPVITFLRIING